MLKKNLIKLVWLSLSTLFVLSACTGNKSKQKLEREKITWDSVHYEAVLAINKDSIRYDIEHNFIFPTNDTVLYRLNMQKVFGDSLVSSTPDSLLKAMAYSFVDEEDKALGMVELDSVAASIPRAENPTWGDYPDYSFFNENSLLYADDNVISIQYYSYAYLGGAHGMGAYYYLPYDRLEQDIITEIDLFDETNKGDFEQLFTKLLLEKMKAEYETYDAEDPMWQSLENVKPNGNFYLTEHNLVYQFNHYEIGAYSMGTPKLEIPYELIQSFVKEDSPIARIIKAKK